MKLGCMLFSEGMSIKCPSSVVCASIYLLWSFLITKEDAPNVSWEGIQTKKGTGHQ